MTATNFTETVAALLDRHADIPPAVARRFARRTPVGSTVEDLEQAALVGVWRAARLLAEGRTFDDFRTYAAKAAINAARKFITTERRRGLARAPKGLAVRVVNEAGPDEGLGLADRAAAAEARDGVAWSAPFWRGVLADLPRRTRLVILMRVIEGKSNEQVGDALGMSPSNVQRIWAAGVTAIRAAHPHLVEELRTH